MAHGQGIKPAALAHGDRVIGPDQAVEADAVPCARLQENGRMRHDVSTGWVGARNYAGRLEEGVVGEGRGEDGKEGRAKGST